MKFPAQWLLAGGCLLALALGSSPVLAQATSTAPAGRPAPVQQALHELSQLYGTRFAFEARVLVGKLTPVRIEPGKSVEELLQAILSPNSLTFSRISPNYYAIVAREQAPAQAPSRTVGGYVQDERGAPLLGATVLASPGSQAGTATDGKGRFSLVVPTAAAALQVSSLGYQAQVVPLAGRSSYAITLAARPDSLAEVQVVSNGYVALPRERVTGSFEVVTGKELAATPTPNLVQRLEGQVAGLQLSILDSDNTFLYQNNVVNPVANNVGQGSYTLRVRGVATLNNDVGDRPLIVLDGVPTEFDVRTLNPSDIAQVTVLKDAAAASIWGVRAANGVLVIQTKQGAYHQAPVVHFSTTLTQAGRPRFNYLPLLNAGQFIDYEQELVSRGILSDPTLAPPTGSPVYLPRAVTAAQDLLFQTQRGTLPAAARDAGLRALAASNRVGYDQLQQYLLQPAQSQTYEVSLRGGGEQATYFLSASYAQERPNAVGNGGSRLTLTANQQFKLWQRATVTAEGKASFFSQRQGGLGLQPLSRQANQVLPYNPLVDANGQGIDYSFAYYAPALDQLDALGYLPYRYNFLAERDIQQNTSTENNYWGALSVGWPLLRGLSVSGLAAAERTYGAQSIYYAPDSYYARATLNQATYYDPATQQLVYGLPLGGIYTPNAVGRNNYTLRGQLTFDRELGRGHQHQVSAIGGVEIRQTEQTSDVQTFYGYNDQSQAYGVVDYRTPYTAIDGTSQTLFNQNAVLDRLYRFRSYFGNAAYTWLGRYSVSGSLRYDDYNNLGLAQRYRAIPLYSAGLAWTLSEESWLRNRAWLSSLRLRATYGLNGNIPAGASPATTISPAAIDPTTGLPYTTLNSSANPTLRWEQTAVANLGVDVSCFGNRLAGTVEVYYKRSTDLFVTYPTNPTYGYSQLARNAASLNGHGVDVTLGGTPVRTASWEWHLGGVLGFNTNRVVDFQLDNSAVVAASGGSAILNNYPTDELLVYRSAGLDNTGRQQVYDHNDKVVNSLTAITAIADLRAAGRLTPAYTSGLTQTLRYKRLTLYAQLVGKFDYVFLPPTFGATPTAQTFVGYDLSADLARRWRQPGDEASTSVVGLLGATGDSYQRYYYADSRVQRGDHVRLREVSLRYALPLRLLGGLNAVKSLSLSLTARNIGLLWRQNKLGIDPDFLPAIQQAKLPPAVSFACTLDATF